MAAAAVLMSVIWAVAIGQQIMRREALRTAPKVTVEELNVAYRKDRAHARRQFAGRLIIITGTVLGMDEGLFGDGAIHLGGGQDLEVECDVGSQFGMVKLGQTARAAGVCGPESNGVLRMERSEVLAP